MIKTAVFVADDADDLKIKLDEFFQQNPDIKKVEGFTQSENHRLTFMGTTIANPQVKATLLYRE